MHGQKTTELLAAMHDRFIVSIGTNSQSGHAEALKAYALGFLCHYILDSTVHPLVFAQQYALCEEGIEGLGGRRASRVAHSTIETEYDEYVMTTHLGATVATFVPHKRALPCSESNLKALSHGISDVVGQTYGLQVRPATFEFAVRLNQLAQAMLDSKSLGLRQHFDYLKPLGMSSAYVLSMSHINAPRHDSVFLNNDHIPWPHPFGKDAVVDASFDEIYVRAAQKARQHIPRFAQSSIDDRCYREITQGVNFSGREL